VSTVVIGIDPSLAHTGLCRIVDDQLQSVMAVITTPEVPRPARLASVRDQVRGFISRGLKTADVLLVAMESEIWTRNPQQHGDAAAIQAILQVMLMELFQERAGLLVDGGRLLSVNPSQVKKWLGAKEKDTVLLQVYKRYGQEFTDHNMADAFTIGMIGRDFLLYEQGKTWPEATKPQLEVLDVLLKPKQKKRKKEKA
jgi:Holliday junction resolvasome RuvABC endonuclease subunit